ncbi:murein L,D-transpeptidase family protein [Methyloceanibacter sp. wino2]|uniref:L,D-transpeptidase family protein n=1 Tax=Methyloceanibacter sp. wino2 TaxID=2170729 RepID=UPI000D3E400E|nr:murein L,D-transpeptidase family protein [Methyloceanibacter sp. wino2]
MRRFTILGAILWACAVVSVAVLAGCTDYYPPHMRPMSSKMRALMAEKGMTPSQPILIRLFKSEAELEVWKQKDDGHYYLLKTYPICKYSGGLGPKQKQGDLQAPEGFYVVDRKRLNPKSHYHLSFNIGYPNAFDRSLNRTGANLMVHGECKSRGCYAMTDPVIEEIYALVAEAFAGGQEKFQVHAFPFRMTTANLAAQTSSKWFDFWVNLKEGYDYFEATRLEPPIAVCGKHYVFNAAFPGGRYPDPRRACPRYQKLPMIAFKPKREQRAVAQSSLAEPLGKDIKLRVGEAAPVYNVMTLGPATPDPEVQGKVKAGDKDKVAQRGAYQN